MADASYFRDYRWEKTKDFPTGRPVGVDPVNPAHAEDGFFKFVSLEGGDRVERHDGRGRFVQVIHDPADADIGTQKVTYEEDDRIVAAVRVDEAGAVRIQETYTFVPDPDSAMPLVEAEIRNADGRLLETQTPRRVGPAAEDIYVTDALGKLKVILHHLQIDKGEPFEIREEWPE